MQTRYLYLLRIILGISDFALLNLCFYLGFYLANKYGHSVNFSIYSENILTCNLIWFVSTGFFRLYTIPVLQSLETIYRFTWRSVVLHGVLFISILFFANQDNVSRLFVLTFYGLTIFSFLMSRFMGTIIEMILMKHFGIRKTVAVLGMNSGGFRLASYLEQQKNVHFQGFLGEEGFYVDESGELIPAAARQLKLAATSGVKEVYVAITPDRLQDAPQLIKEAEKQCIRLKFVPDMNAHITPFQISYMGEFPILSVRHEPLEDIQSRVKKRFFDVVFSLLVIVFVISWLYPLLALIIKIQSPGPVLFKQMRSGRDNQPFWCYKFRSMHVNAHSESTQAHKGDSRITAIGRFMRRTSLDEFPQFFNVLFGNMSIAGPRPHMLNHTEEYRAIIDQYMVRQFLKPGITGWAQVNGYRGETKDPSLMQKRVEHDIWYMENWSAMLDLRIVFITIFSILKGEENAF